MGVEPYTAAEGGGSGAQAELAQDLFVPLERYGWEYSEPPATVPSPLSGQRPAWQEPAHPDWHWHDNDNKHGLRKCAWRLVGTLIIAWLGSMSPWGDWLVPIAAAIGLTASIRAAVLPRRKLQKARAEHQERRDTLLELYRSAEREWAAEVARHDQIERERVAAAERWFPLRLPQGWSRVDVFGGTPDGWASLLTTLGASVLEAGNDVLILDLSENHVAEDLARFARMHDVAVSHLSLPGDSSRVDLLSGLAAEDVGELVANAAHPRKDKAEQDLRALDADLIEIVAERLAKPYSFARLEAGIRVLRRVYDTSREGLLTAEEVRELNSDVDAAGGTEKARERLQFLNGQLKRLIHGHGNRVDIVGDRNTVSVLDGGRVWHSGGLTLVETQSSHERRKGLYDRIVFHRVLRDLHAEHRAGSQAVIVVAGADHLGLESLEVMSHQAKRVGVRLVLLMEHLRDELKHLLGGSDSASIVMRLGNHTEATAAADFLGKGYKFVLSQVSEQIGKTFTTGTARSDGGSDTTTRTTTASEGGSRSQGQGQSRGQDDTTQAKNRASSTNWGTSTSWGTSQSGSHSRAATWQTTVNDSMAASTTAGQTATRVYEYEVEPTTIQGLPPTVCFLVESGKDGNRRVVVGDCNPGIALLDRVSIEPIAGSEELG